MYKLSIWYYVLKINKNQTEFCIAKPLTFKHLHINKQLSYIYHIYHSIEEDYRKMEIQLEKLRKDKLHRPRFHQFHQLWRQRRCSLQGSLAAHSRQVLERFERHFSQPHFSDQAASIQASVAQRDRPQVKAPDPFAA